MNDLTPMIDELALVKNGFKPIEKMRDTLLEQHPPDALVEMANALYRSEIHQARMLATLLYGSLAPSHPDLLSFLRGTVSHDPNWRVQEMLAMAFDTWCSSIGYEAALPTIESWLADPEPNVRRAPSEGLRIWTSRPYFRTHPGEAIALLSRLKDDDHAYVRSSAGNALRDISRRHPVLLAAELETWDLTDKRIRATHALAARFLLRAATAGEPSPESRG